MLQLADSNKTHIDRICFLFNKARVHLIKAKNNLVNEMLFPASYNIPSTTKADASYSSDDKETKDGNNDTAKDDTVNLVRTSTRQKTSVSPSTWASQRESKKLSPRPLLNRAPR